MARHSRAEWARWVKEWRRSGESARVFAEARGLRPGTLGWWSSRLRGGAQRPRKGSALELVPVTIEDAPASSDSSCAWEVLLPGGYVLRVFRDLDPTAWPALVSAIAQLPPRG